MINSTLRGTIRTRPAQRPWLNSYLFYCRAASSSRRRERPVGRDVRAADRDVASQPWTEVAEALREKSKTELPCKLIVHVVLFPRSSTTTLDTGAPAAAAIAKAGQIANDTRW